MYSSYERERKINDALETFLIGLVTLTLLPLLPVVLPIWLIGKAVRWCVGLCISVRTHL